MSCTCIADFNAKLAPAHELDTSMTISRGDNPSLMLTTYTALIRKDSGKPERRSSQPRLAVHGYCPFCGVSLASPKCAGHTAPVESAAEPESFETDLRQGVTFIQHAVLDLVGEPVEREIMTNSHLDAVTSYVTEAVTSQANSTKIFCCIRAAAILITLAEKLNAKAEASAEGGAA